MQLSGQKTSEDSKCFHALNIFYTLQLKFCYVNYSVEQCTKCVVVLIRPAANKRTFLDVITKKLWGCTRSSLNGLRLHRQALRCQNDPVSVFCNTMCYLSS